MNTAAIRERTARLGSDQIVSRSKRLNPLYSSDCQTSCRNAEGHRVASLFLDDEKRGQGLGAEGSPPRSRDAALIHDTTGAQSTLHAVLRGNPATRWWRAGCDYSRNAKNRALQNKHFPEAKKNFIWGLTERAARLSLPPKYAWGLCSRGPVHFLTEQ